MTHVPLATDSATPVSPQDEPEQTTQNNAQEVSEPRLYTQEEVDKAINDALAARGRDKDSIESGVRSELQGQIDALATENESLKSELTMIEAYFATTNEVIFATLSDALSEDKLSLLESQIAGGSAFQTFQTLEIYRSLIDEAGNTARSFHLPSAPAGIHEPEKKTVGEMIAQYL